ncbi:Xaa-Pro dipeptidase [Thalassotalea euphylliae]|uniref:Xaa-Pro dipeptidase n=1 Tax=Thalassotalea euphylliae TaxID=1655234 RepID=A0A3E0TLF0_9GAMM|nr:Xaa-Pro dipeptidase [Thalassotalea euphylliae]REL25100.1 Xaa-Pro dipeptidase [Thalassotalea euphylliae]
MTNLANVYSDHINELQARARNVLNRENLEGLVIHSGKELKVFLDDNSYPFKVNPHFKHWLPLTNVTNSWLLINGNDKPVLVYYQPVDFWHKVETLQDDFWTPFFDIKVITNAAQVDALLPYDKANYAYLGEHIEVAKALGFEQINPDGALSYLHFHRAYKTPYEQALMRLSNERAVAGHVAAKAAFMAGESEFEIQRAYLQATSHTDSETPYGNIVALNENAAILHYTALERDKPAQHRSFLIDAGANYHGYASDITRTYAFEQNDFAELIARMDKLMLNAVDGLKPGKSYVELHCETYLDIGRVLAEFNIINCSAEVAAEQGIVSTFFPHGLGHHLGLQVHDVGGFMADERGTHIDSPAKHPFLRTSRAVEAGQVFTIEPGLYFIDSLLGELKAGEHSHAVNWAQVEKFKPFGGIRIEDNIIVHQSHNENMTRDLDLG